MKKFLTLLCVFMMVFALGIIACSDDDSDDDSTCNEACTNMAQVMTDDEVCMLMEESSGCGITDELFVGFCELNCSGNDPDDPVAWPQSQVDCAANASSFQAIGNCFPDGE